MKKLSLIFSIFIILLSTFSFLGCKSVNDSFVYTTFGTNVTVAVQEKALTNEVTEQIKHLLDSLENEFSVNKNNSALSAINSSATQTLSERGVEVFSLAKEFYSFSNGKFNPATYPLSRLWHFTEDTKLDKNNFTPPTEQQILEIIDKGILDFDKVTLNDNLLAKENEDIKIDLGGMLKGYACDLVLDILTTNGYDKGYISFGTSSMCLLEVETLSLRHPEKNTDVLLKINAKDLKNVSVSTSGDYEKFYLHEGVRYSHIIDSKTGYPYSTGIISATLLGANGAFLDAMTTALCNCDFDEEKPLDNELINFMRKILQREESASIYAVYSKNDIKYLITNKKQGVDFTLLDDNYEIVNI